MLERGKDGLNFLSKQTWSRTKNILSNYSGYLQSRYSKDPRHHGLPISISIEPTTACNLRCPECPSGLRSFTRPTGMLEPALFHKVIDELAPTLSYLIFYFQGEPFLHKNFLELVSYASERGVYTATSTNGHFINEDTSRRIVKSGLDRLIISIDGTTQETFESYRVGGQLDKVLNGAKQMMEAKKEMGSATPHVMFQFLVVRPNEHQIEDVKSLAGEIGVNEVKFKTAQIYDYQHGNDLIPTIDKYSRYKRTSNGQFAIKNKLLDHCWKMWHSCVITWDGKVVPCCFDKDAHHVMGDCNNKSFGEIWNSDSYRLFRQQLFQSRSTIEMCRNCTEGTKVWA